MESENLKNDEYLELHEVEHKEELEDSSFLIYYYEGMLADETKIQAIEKISINTESHTMNAKSHLDIKLHSAVEL